jgi:hypothetical protein
LRGFNWLQDLLEHICSKGYHRDVNGEEKDGRGKVDEYIEEVIE